MRSKELALKVGCHFTYIQKLTKKALQNGLSFIEVAGERYNFSLVSGVGGRGKVYEYEKVLLTAQKRKKRGVSKVLVSEVPRVDLNSPTLEQKVSICRYYKWHTPSVRALAEVLNQQNGGAYKITAVEKRLKRWFEAYKKGGKPALKDKRGGKKMSKVEWELFLMSITNKAHVFSYYSRYCYLWCKKYDKPIDVLNPSSNISYEGFKNFFNKHKDDVYVKAILKGKDALDEITPVFNSKKYVDYPNELWQIDATKLDIMVKVPVVDGEPNYFKKCESDEYILARYTLNGVVDVYSGARVYILGRNGNSYLNARLLKKAIETLGVPETIKGDNGKDYISEHFQNTLEMIGIDYIAATPYKGSEKGKVERGFRTLQHSYLFQNLAGFIGHNTEDRQTLEAQHTKKSERSTAKGTQTNIKGSFMWWWEAEKVLDGLVNHLFEKQMKDHKSLADMSESIPNLHIKLGRRYLRKVQREGVSLNKTYYMSPKMWERVAVGEYVEVYEDIDDMSFVYIKVGDEEFIKLQSMADMSLSVEEAKEIKKAYKQRVNKEIKKIYRSGQSEFDKLNELTKVSLFEKSTIQESVIQRVQSLKESNKKEYENTKDMLEEFMAAQGY